MATALENLFHRDIDVRDAVQFFLAADARRANPDVTPLKLHKLLYLAQANYLASTGSRLFDEPVDAYENGPVIYTVTRMFSGRQIIATTVDEAKLTAPELPTDVDVFLGRVWASYKDWSASSLWNLTHSQSPWAENYVEGEYRCQIPDEDMVEFFRSKVPARDRVFHDNVTVIPSDLIHNLDEREDELVEKMIEFFD